MKILKKNVQQSDLSCIIQFITLYVKYNKQCDFCYLQMIVLYNLYVWYVALPARPEPHGRRDLLVGPLALGGRRGRAGRAVGAGGRRGLAGRAGVAAPRRRHVAHAPAHVPLPARQRRRLPVRADAGRRPPAAGAAALAARPHAPLDPVRAHARLHHAHR